MVAGSRRSASVICSPLTKPVTSAGGSVSIAATAGATPRAAAHSLACISALRSMPSSEVSLPGMRIT